jgi:hypothetical protein
VKTSGRKASKVRRAAAGSAVSGAMIWVWMPVSAASRMRARHSSALPMMAMSSAS